ncbi:cytokine-like nuclear factor N-PAC isoform X2 [Watersipora subatra]|uniref:cytokine-like nuclear factor N-PAC isoform X2 n=1 Tax=Watersipora subatra TaxID=2589382 RepID=UPI00355B1072
MAANTKFGKIVWAKVKGSSPWPAKSVDPTIKRPVKKGNWHFVRFYGSNDHAWVDYDTHIWPYKEFRMRYGARDKAPQLFREGVEEADDEYTKLSPEDLPAKDHDLIPETDHKPKSKVQPPVKSQDTSKTLSAASKNTAAVKSSATVTTPAGKLAKPLVSAKTTNRTEDVKPVRATASITTIGKRVGRIVNTQKRKVATDDSDSEPLSKIVKSPVAVSNANGLETSPDKTNRLSTTQARYMKDASPRRTQVKAKVFEFEDTDTLMNTLSNKRNIRPIGCKIGFIGLGIMGLGMVRNLVKFGHKVCIWNKTPSKCEELKRELSAVQVCDTPAHVVSLSDITFACVADPFAVKEVLFCQNGVLESIRPGKAFVDMSTVDLETVNDSEHQITKKGGDYLEARISGSKSDAANGSLLFLTAGNKKLYDRCASCFQAMGRQSYFLGAVGDGTRMILCLNLVQGSINTAVAEGMALAERVGMKQSDLLDILGDSANELIANTSKAIIAKKFTPQLSLQHIQKDLRLAVEMADMYDQPLQVAASVNELYKRAKSMGLSNLDMSAVYKAASK